MAMHQPVFYPKLRLRKAKSFAPRTGGYLRTYDMKFPKVRQADNLYKPFNVYTKNLIDSVETQNFLGYGSGIRNPNWRVTIAKGGDATSAYSTERFQVRPLSYRVIAEGANNLSKGYGTLCGSHIRLENSTTALDDRALASLKNKLNGKIGNAQLGPPIAESREIHRLVRQINDFGMDALRAMLAAKQSKGKSVTKLAGNIWLGFAFGVNPLLKDIQTAADSILHYVTRRDSRIVVSGTANQEYHSGSVDTGSSEYIAQDCAYGFYRSAHHKQGIRYEAAVDLQVRGGSNYSVPDHLGLKVEQLPSILWELTPFSWAVDYFTTVGSWLEDMFYTLPATVKFVSKSYKYQSETVSSLKAFPTAGTRVLITAGSSYVRYNIFVRSQLAPVLPTRSLRIKSVDEIASHGVTKLINLASVLAGFHGPKLGELTPTFPGLRRPFTNVNK